MRRTLLCAPAAPHASPPPARAAALQLERIDAGAAEVLASVAGQASGNHLLQFPRGYHPRRPVRAVAIRYVAPWWLVALPPFAHNHILSYIGEPSAGLRWQVRRRARWGRGGGGGRGSGSVGGKPGGHSWVWVTGS